jgi:hypothetical protein
MGQVLDGMLYGRVPELLWIHLVPPSYVGYPIGFQLRFWPPVRSLGASSPLDPPCRTRRPGRRRALHRYWRKHFAARAAHYGVSE